MSLRVHTCVRACEHARGRACACEPVGAPALPRSWSELPDFLTTSPLLLPPVDSPGLDARTARLVRAAHVVVCTGGGGGVAGRLRHSRSRVASGPGWGLRGSGARRSPPSSGSGSARGWLPAFSPLTLPPLLSPPGRGRRRDGPDGGRGRGGGGEGAGEPGEAAVLPGLRLPGQPGVRGRGGPPGLQGRAALRPPAVHGPPSSGRPVTPRRPSPPSYSDSLGREVETDFLSGTRPPPRG